MAFVLRLAPLRLPASCHSEIVVEQPPRVLAIPFRDDVLDPSDNWKASVQRIVIGAPIGRHVVPQGQHTDFGCDFQPKLGEIRLSAFARGMQANHRGPGALPAALCFIGPVAFAYMQVIIVMLELLPRLIALALDSFGVVVVNSQQVRDIQVYASCQRIFRFEVVRATGAETVAIRPFEQAGRLRLGIDDAYDLPAIAALEKTGHLKDFGKIGVDASDLGVGKQSAARHFAKPRQLARIGLFADGAGRSGLRLSHSGCLPEYG